MEHSGGAAAMKTLIIGGGGREHALAWKAAQSDRVETVFVAPGNAGTALESKVVNVPIPAADASALLAFARERGVGLTIVGPEAPLVAGIVDRFAAAGLACCGPAKAAARLEGSKTFSKAFMRRHGIPTAEAASFTEVEAALAYLRRRAAPVVVKADGLAGGKGVVVAHDTAVAEAAVRDMLGGRRFGAAGRRVLIEEFLRGEEASFIVLCDGERALPLAASQDHKARDDGDRGPNTGGMGAYSPPPVATAATREAIMRRIILPTIDGMRAEGAPYRGFLYAGLMIDEAGEPKALEFNCRLGDPEAQVILPRLRGDLAEWCLPAAEGRLPAAVDEGVWDERAAVGVVLAAAGYPGEVAVGEAISGLPSSFPQIPPEAQEREESSATTVKIFHGATKRDRENILTAGGRVLCVTALARDVAAARDAAYRAARQIRCPGLFYRRDIAHRATRREGAAD